MHAFTVHPQKTPAPPPADERPRRRGRWLAALALLLLVGLTAGALRPSRLDRVKALQKELFTAAAKNLPPDQRKAKFEELRTAMKGLNDDQKWDLAAPMREKQQAELGRYFALSPKEKTAYLDERINRSEQMKKDFAKKTGTTGGRFGGPPGGGGGQGPPSAGQVNERRREMLDRTTPEDRARRDAFRRDLENRRRQRGLPPGGRG